MFSIAIFRFRSIRNCMGNLMNASNYMFSFDSGVVSALVIHLRPTEEMRDMEFSVWTIK